MRFILRISTAALAACVLLLTTPASASPRDCVLKAIQLMRGDYPGSVSTAVAHVHRYKLGWRKDPMLISVLVPSKKGFPKAQIKDLVDQPFNEPWPQRFVLSDGDPTGQGDFIYVDRRPGSPLDYEVNRIQGWLKRNGYDAKEDLEKYLTGVMKLTRSLWNPDDPDSLKALSTSEWTPPAPFSLSTEEAKRTWSDIGDKDPSAEVFELNLKKEVVPFENHLCGAASTMCIHNALLASLILQNAGVPHRLKTGFGTTGFRPSVNNTGHSLIELADGRFFDPTWKFNKQPKRHRRHEGWYKTPSFWYSPYQHFPYLILE